MRSYWEKQEPKSVNSIPGKLTLRELIEIVPDTGDSKVPTFRQLCEGGDTILFAVKTEKFQLFVYTSGWFAYRVGRFVTVQGIHRCTENLEYRYQDGTVATIGGASFMDSPCMVRLALEGERRLAHNQLAREKQKHVYSYDNLSSESADLCDSVDIAEELANRDEWKGLHQSLLQALEQLTEKQKQAIYLYFIEERTQQEIADMLGCKRQTVNEAIRSALQKMKKLMENA